MHDATGSALTQRTIGHYLEALSDGSPTPGGGSAAGMAGAMGCALGSMVCRLTLARDPIDTVAEQQQTLIALQESMLAAARADELVFGAYRAAAEMPRQTEIEKRERRDAIERTLIAAAEVPVELVTLGLDALAVLHSTAAVGTRHAIGDLLTGGYLLQAMVLGSLENIQANAHLMKQPENKARFEQAVVSARADLELAMATLNIAVAERLDQKTVSRVK